MFQNSMSLVFVPFDWITSCFKYFLSKLYDQTEILIAMSTFGLSLKTLHPLH